MNALYMSKTLFCTSTNNSKNKIFGGMISVICLTTAFSDLPIVLYLYNFEFQKQLLKNQCFQ